MKRKKKISIFIILNLVNLKFKLQFKFKIKISIFEISNVQKINKFWDFYLEINLGPTGGTYLIKLIFDII